ncbi:ImmA/IrrE family metallo-endopeptidase [Coleofasciculus sp.]|uniref:ImmA/IrrE family metallo-endopeptidase n=1 Tax=Coleofasciculus sp. TaxID=3100458 RepID=UPI00406332D0
MMKLRRGFKKEANNYSREFRAELGLKPHAPLCPWKLSDLLGIPVVPLSEFKNECPTQTDYLTQKNRECFSAVTVFNGHRRLIVHNDSHHPHRQASNIAHELSHGILQHPPTAPFSEYGCRNFNKTIEDEANWLGPALLISEEAALHIVKRKISMDEAANFYGATKQVIRMRINVTGAKKRVAVQYTA